MATDWVEVAAAADVPADPPWPEVAVDGDAVVLFRDAEHGIHAAVSRCPHLGAPLTSAAVVDGCIECNRHFYAYDIATGENVVPGDLDDFAVAMLDVEVRDGGVWLRPRPGVEGVDSGVAAEDAE